MRKLTFKVTAPFSNNGQAWFWLTWNVETGNKHEAVLVKAAEIGAKFWDFGQVDFVRN